MPDLIIKPTATSGNKLILKDQAGGAVLTTADSGATLGNSTQDNITRVGTVTSGSIGSGVTGLTGIKNCDTWRITSNFQIPDVGNNYLTANWERDDTGMMSQTIGTGMTESSGIFSFPSTGLWLVMTNFLVNTGTTGSWAGFLSLFTRNNGTDSYGGTLSENYCHVASNMHISGASAQGILDVTDISNVKMKFNFKVHSSGSSTTLGGNTNVNYSCVTFIRIGDT